MLTERDFAVDVVRRLQAAGFQALWAGGCVRDELLALEPNDYDVATSARPEEVQRLFSRSIAIGASFGVIEVLGPRLDGQWLKIQVATFRSDGAYSDGRRPDEVTFSSPREDALRRDFTINGMFFDPVAGQLLDYVGGRDDLDAKILRAIGDPAERFKEDKLRLLRAARMATRFNLVIAPATALAIKQMAPEITVVSAERIAEELRLLLVRPRRAAGVSLMFDLGLVEPLLPELLALRGVANHWDCVLSVLDRLDPGPTFPLAFAALLHEIDNPSAICARFKLSNNERERISWLIENQQALREARQMRPSKLKTLLNHPGIRELLALHRALASATGASLDPIEFCELRLGQWTADDLDPMPLLTGHDLAGLGLEPGPLFKELLTSLREAQLDGVIGDREGAHRFVEQMLAKTRDSLEK